MATFNKSILHSLFIHTFSIAKCLHKPILTMLLYRKWLRRHRLWYMLKEAEIEVVIS